MNLPPVLNKRIGVMRPILTRQPSGALVKSWSPVVLVHAHVEWLESSSYHAALAEQSGCSVRATVRRRDVAVGHRVVVADRTLKVKSVQPGRHPGYWQLMLEQDDGNG